MADIKRVITALDIQNATRLKTIYDRKKKELGLTHKRIANLLDIAQPSVSNHLNGSRPLSTQRILEYAKLLQVDPKEINPKIGKLLPAKQAREAKFTIPIMGSLTGERIVGALCSDLYPIEQGWYAIKLTDGGCLLVNPPGILTRGQDVVYIDDTCRPGQYRWARLYDINSRTATFIHKETNEKYKLPVSRILLIHAVCGIVE